MMAIMAKMPKAYGYKSHLIILSEDIPARPEAISIWAP